MAGMLCMPYMFLMHGMHGAIRNVHGMYGVYTIYDMHGMHRMRACGTHPPSRRPWPRLVTPLVTRVPHSLVPITIHKATWQIDYHERTPFARNRIANLATD